MKRWLCYCLVLSAMGLWFLFDSRAVVLAGLICAGAIPLCSGLVCRILCKKASIVPECIGLARKGEAVPISLRCSGLGGLRAEGQLICRNGKTGELLEQSIRLDRTQTVRLSVRSCGPVTIRLTKVRLRDPFGLWNFRLEDRSCSLTVAAMPFPMRLSVSETAAPLLDSDRYSPDRPGNDPSETFGVREYTPGDSIKQIHWKLSGKSDRVFIRELGLPITDQLMILMDTRGQQSAVTEAAASVSTAMAQAGLEHTLAWNAPDTGHLQQLRISAVADAEAAIRTISDLPAAQHALSAAESFLREFDHCSFTHAILISDRPMDGAEDLFSGNRVTALVADSSGDDGLQADGIVRIGFDPSDMAARLRCLEV